MGRMGYKPTVGEKVTAGQKFLDYMLVKHGKAVLDIDTKESVRMEYQKFRATDVGKSMRGCSFAPIWRQLTFYSKSIIFRGGMVEYPCYAVALGLAFNQSGRDPKKDNINLLDEVKENRYLCAQDKNNIEVTSIPDGDKNGNIGLKIERNSHTTIILDVFNNNDDKIVLNGCKVLQMYKILSIHKNRPILIQPYDQYTVEINCKPKYFGKYKAEIVLEFKRLGAGDLGENFCIARYLTVTVSSQVTNDLGPTSPYTGPKKIFHRDQPSEIVEGIKPNFYEKVQLKMKQLPYYNVSENIKILLNKAVLAETLSMDNYRSKFSTLLHMEEVQMKDDICAYDLESVEMEEPRNERGLLRLRVEGLAENRPSILKGDHVLVNLNNNGVAETKKYKGYAHRIQDVDVLLGFNKQLLNRFVSGLKFNVQFSFNRFPLRIQHHSLEKLSGFDELLFPSEKTINNRIDLKSIREVNYFYDRKIEKNEEQSQAVKQIVCGSSRPAPYLIFGPPGTGKTVTMVEAIKQVYKLLPGSHILCCAPSNSAADLIAARLLKDTPVIKSTIIRLNAMSRPWISIEKSLLENEVCNFDTYGNVYFPDIETLKNYRIIVTTLVTAGRLALAEFPENHFTHVFVDEAGQAIETESIIPVSGLLNPYNPNWGQLVLVGDPKQLGPVLRSRPAIDCKLDISLLERLMSDHDVYRKQGEDGCYDKKVLTKLLRNYRSHPAILDQPNKMFYDGELQVCADELIRTSLCDWDQLPKKNFPVIFHGVEGDDIREGNSPSYFNLLEIECVWQYISNLLEKRGNMRITQKDIGVISPYRRQVQKIQKLLSGKRLRDIKVGTVEEFQGQERLVIIISTVRSNKVENIKVDQKFNLGFLRNPKRFNVAITRAKALLILIGNPNLLSLDENWNRFLTYCKSSGGCTGIECSSEEELEISEELYNLNLDTDAEPKSEISSIAQQIDPSWPHKE